MMLNEKAMQQVERIVKVSGLKKETVIDLMSNNWIHHEYPDAVGIDRNVMFTKHINEWEFRNAK